MRNQAIIIFLTTLFPANFYSQDVNLLDEKSGFKDIKIGQSLTSVAGKYVEDKKANDHYNIENTAQYEIENQKINNIIIRVSNKDHNTIEAFSMLFRPKQDLDMENKSYDFYFKLFKDAFGEPTDKKSDASIWNGENIKLTAQKIAGFGVISFQKILSENEKEEQAEKASNKF